MSRLFETYRCVHRQAFVPLFVHDDRDSHLLLEACVEAGCRVVEYTLRRSDAHTMIPWIRHRFPDIHILVGSTLDDDAIVRQVRRRHPQMRTLAELADMGVDGFVSYVGWNPDNIRKHAETHLVIPAAMTANEAYQQLAAGAHFIKLFGPEADVVRMCRNPAMFGICPVFITGGMTPERMPDAVAAGAMVAGSGFDLMLKDAATAGDAASIARVIRRYAEAMRSARRLAWPQLTEAETGDTRTWLAALPHVHPFSEPAGEV